LAEAPFCRTLNPDAGNPRWKGEEKCCVRLVQDGAGLGGCSLQKALVNPVSSLSRIKIKFL